MRPVGAALNLSSSRPITNLGTHKAGLPRRLVLLDVLLVSAGPQLPVRHCGYLQAAVGRVAELPLAHYLAPSAMLNRAAAGVGVRVAVLEIERRAVSLATRASATIASINEAWNKGATTRSPRAWASAHPVLLSCPPTKSSISWPTPTSILPWLAWQSLCAASRRSSPTMIIHQINNHQLPHLPPLHHSSLLLPPLHQTPPPLLSPLLPSLAPTSSPRHPH